ncbi:hypothetical protein Clacol_010264 [Clathrus columnatus]|uniref:Uncharacterized protein n=1 Tax=Clathrus columnatus TaxID=1419009 RepID=A0AAV5AVS6_9AGAM|nr:hypothetical protein Clacol_010264 [Clathrus columnatus]
MSSKPKVICLGLGRTGTTSLMEALNILELGPCYHMIRIFQNHNVEEVNTWINVSQGSTTLDDIRTLLKDYNSIMDYPSAIYYEQLYQIYPDAKFILTTRDPVKWETSIKSTILQAINDVFPNVPNPDSWWTSIRTWFEKEMLDRYHKGKLYTDTQAELIAHNRRVMETIPADKLLIYEISQGWDPLRNKLVLEFGGAYRAEA